MFNFFTRFSASRLAAVWIMLFGGYSVQGLAAYEFVTSFGSTGSSNGQFLAPRGVAVSLLGKIIITESVNNRISVCTEQGSCTTFGDFGTLSGEFDRPRGVAVNSVDRLFIADRGNSRIESCAITGSCTDFGGSGSVLGKFASPRGVAIDPQDLIYITDTGNNRVQICNLQGVCSTAFGSFGSALGQFDSPSGIAIDNEGRIIIADRGNSRIQICSAQGTNCTSFGSAGSGLGQFDQPAGVAVDSKNQIIIVDRFNDRVQICTHQGSCTAFGGFGTTAGKFDRPWGVAVDNLDRIIVADLGNDRVQIFANGTAPAVEISSFTATPTTLEEGQSTTLAWSVNNATSCIATHGTPDWRVITPATSGGNLVISIAVEGNYSFVLECTDGSSTASATVDVTVTLKANSTPTQPGLLSASDVTTSSATVSWGVSTDADGDTITYKVDYRRSGDTLWTSAGSTTTIGLALSSLDANQSYDVRVTPNDGSVDGNNRATLNLFKTDVLNTAPTQPGLFSASSVTSDSAIVSWGASSDAQGDSITYRVIYRSSGSTQWFSAGSTTDTSQPLVGLNADQSYDVQVTPNDGIIDGSSRIKFGLFKTKVINSPPGQPGVLFASAITIDSATVSWGVSTDINGDSITYRVEYRSAGATLWTSGGSTSEISRVLTGLLDDQSYDVRITPNDGTVDGIDRITLNLFKTLVDPDKIFRNGFEGN